MYAAEIARWIKNWQELVSDVISKSDYAHIQIKIEEGGGANVRIARNPERMYRWHHR